MTVKARVASAILAVSVGAVTVAAEADRSATPAGHAAPPAVTVAAPQGEYAQVRLRFAPTGGADAGASAVDYAGSMRDGRVRVDHGAGVREPGGTLELKDGRLTGSFTRVVGIKPARIARVTVDATVKGPDIAGTCTIDGAAGTVAGTITPEAELARDNAVRADKGWPSYLGPANSTATALPTGVETVDSLAGLRLVWRSEEPMPQGLAPLSRFMDKWKDASVIRTGGGGWSPVLADGRVYSAYFVPSPERVDDAAMASLKQTAPPEQQDQPLPEHAREKAYASADEVVVATDAATGKTLWKTVVKGRGLNLQHHKSGPFNLSPAAGGGQVFAIGTSGFLYAFDAHTGELLWDVRVAEDRPQKAFVGALGQSSSYTPVAFDGVVVAPDRGKWAGYDAATGKRLWTDPRGAPHASVVRWVHGGTDYLLAVMGARGDGARGDLTCLDPRTGKEHWKLPIHVVSGGRGLGPGGLSVFGDTLVAVRGEPPAPAEGKSKPEPSDVRICAAWRLSPAKPQPLWEVPLKQIDKQPAGECVPVLAHGRYVVTQDLQVIELATGKVTGRGDGMIPMNGGYLLAVEDLVLVRRDGTHGEIEMGAYRIDDAGKPTVVDAGPENEWEPAVGGSTTSYHHPIMYPIVDGRLFVRQYDGIYCYDLRKPKPAGETVPRAAR